MADGYSWSDLRDGGVYKLPDPEHLGWWAGIAMFISILLHVAVFFALDRMKIAFSFEKAHELTTRNVSLNPVEVRPLDTERAATPEDLVIPPNDAASLLEEVDLLSALPKNSAIDIKPDIEEAEYALQMHSPAMAGDPAAIAMEVSARMEVDADLPEPGREPERLRPAEMGQVTVDPGAVPLDDSHLAKFTDNLMKRGAKGTFEKGALDGIASLDDLLGLSSSLLLGKKTMLPSDLLFEFNSAELRESAKVGLMKLALLMDRNPDLYCWIEGHTDLVGGDDFNLELSARRAEAVKTYLTESLRMDAAKIRTRGFGRYQPLVISGTTEEQAINRRVEIRMRETPPPSGPHFRVPAKKPAAVVDPLPSAPRAVLVRPQRVPPVIPEPPAADDTPAPPRAAPVVDLQPLPAVPRATPVELPPPPPTAVPRARPVNE